MEFVWARMKSGYGTRYEEGGAREYISAFFNSIEDADLSRIVAHCDRTAESMVAQETPMFLDDDLAPEGDAEDDPEWEEGGDVGEMPDF